MIQFAGIALILIGIYGLMTTKHMIKLIIALNVMELGANIFIISIGFVAHGLAPIYTADLPNQAFSFVDPLPQAMVLTAIVIGFGVSALGLVVAQNIYKKHGTYDLSEIGGEE